MEQYNKHMSGNFNKEKFERIFRVKRFEVENRQSKEFKEIIKKFARENIRGSYSINSRFEMKGDHFKEILDVWIESLIESFEHDEINPEAKIPIQRLFKDYTSHYIENEQRGFQSAMISYGHKPDSSIINDSLSSIKNKLYIIRNVRLDKLIIAIDKHNNSLVIAEHSNIPSYEKHNQTLTNLKNNNSNNNLWEKYLKELIIGIIITVIGGIILYLII